MATSKERSAFFMDKADAEVQGSGWDMRGANAMAAIQRR
jgi:hypothetical protein